MNAEKLIKYSFKNDYSEGCHLAILEELLQSNRVQYNGYGDDGFTNEAVLAIQQHIQHPDADIHLVTGGTQANLIIISALLRSYESVIAASTAHIHVHEAGAIEATGHKIDIINSSDGKLNADDVKSFLARVEAVHMAKPRMVYISNSTEIGTLYQKQELIELYAFCRENGLLLFMDGARLGSALCASVNDLTLADIAKYTDVFYIGGTKNGALLGEAIVINNTALQPDFIYNLKQRGALLAKGRLLGVQFAVLFRGKLYFELAAHANRLAAKISAAIQQLGLPLLTISYTNQIFPILPVGVIAYLQQYYEFYIWQQMGNGQAAIRLVTSWATNEARVDKFITHLSEAVNIGR